MKTRLEDLIQKASVAQPPDTLSRSSWTPYLPIIRILMEERAHTLMAAVEWLVGQGEIPADRQAMAYRALRQILARREAKKHRQQARLQRQFQVPPRPPAAASALPGPVPQTPPPAVLSTLAETLPAYAQ
ncbi:hypothetical protein EI77_04260 [Prosthecobacter fusiformis]|uniref:Uncharacterized protein n=1 Tax=Prosthecobacter fusiformis TaxID=48464 RepID=A0A4R7RK50_9BACT|nr:hypothetical protein [Prosthecobacter fusiformis]TDU64076.1 hypothetical protein EI77_04260 [Prosthecobacter fusiformis]